MTHWEKEMEIEHINEMLLAHEIIVYNVDSGNKRMEEEEDVVTSRGLILQAVKNLINKSK